MATLGGSRAGSAGIAFEGQKCFDRQVARFGIQSPSNHDSRPISCTNASHLIYGSLKVYRKHGGKIQDGIDLVLEFPDHDISMVYQVQAPFSACLKNEREIQIDKLRGMKPTIYDTMNGKKTIVEKLVQRRLRHVEQERLSLLDSEQRWRFELTTNRDAIECVELLRGDIFMGISEEATKTIYNDNIVGTMRYVQLWYTHDKDMLVVFPSTDDAEMEEYRALDTSRALSSGNACCRAELDSEAEGHSLGVINHLSPHPYPRDQRVIPTVVKIAFKTKEELNDLCALFLRAQSLRNLYSFEELLRPAELCSVPLTAPVYSAPSAPPPSSSSIAIPASDRLKQLERQNRELEKEIQELKEKEPHWRAHKDRRRFKTAVGRAQEQSRPRDREPLPPKVEQQSLDEHKEEFQANVRPLDAKKAGKTLSSSIWAPGHQAEPLTKTEHC